MNGTEGKYASPSTTIPSSSGESRTRRKTKRLIRAISTRPAARTGETNADRCSYAGEVLSAKSWREPSSCCAMSESCRMPAVSGGLR